MRIFLISCFILISCRLNSQPVALHPDNPHYLIYNGKPLIIISSGEHYGAVMNLDFDYTKYLIALERDGMNYTRVFSGFYMETPGQFGIKHNSLAPSSSRLIIPWSRCSVPGYKNGGNKFDLENWDTEYFVRLKSFLTEAEKRNIIVEITLFTSIYNNENWEIHPFNPANNINNTQADDFRKVNLLHYPAILAYQEKMVRKIVRELNSYNNLIFEIQNEPWADNGKNVLNINEYDPESGKAWVRHVDIAGDSSLQWQRQIARIIADEEKRLPNKHLIAQNYCNFKYPVRQAEPEIGIMNFHYVHPENVLLNYGHNRVISFDESGFSGPESVTYRKQAWNFILAGGGVFNNLDYSFFPGYEDGTGVNDAPGGGDSSLRKQLKVLKDFIEGMNFVKMKPDSNIIRHAPGLFSRSLSWQGREYAIYFEGSGNVEISLSLPEGIYNLQWHDVENGSIMHSETINSGSGLVMIKSPGFRDYAALKIVAR